MSIKLRDLIRAVRACKTAAEERAVISKECALIRTAIKEEDDKFRHRNVAKLMFIHMLGYPTHFGQMECLKLISAQTFPEKRIGYLGLTLLLTEQTEVLTLVTNSLKLDLTNPNQYIQALSLITIGNLATQDMARDLASDVEKLLRSNNSYLRKKAALAAIRLLKKEPDLIEHMSERIVSLLKDRSHGVLVTGIQLMVEVLHLIPETKAEYVKLVPSLVRLLRNFISMGFSPEHDVSGITDPFMQVKILHLLKLLGKGNEEASEQMNDVLAQVATNTETTKNAGNAILYECVQTIMEVESDSSLRVLAVNILGRFLLNRDNNIRYVALNSLSKVVSEDIAAVQRHRNTIVDCLKDPDISIRQRALELIYQLVNETNVTVLTTELLNYLVVAQVDHKASLVSKIIQIVEKYSPSKKWRVDTVVTMLSIAGNITEDAVTQTAIIFIAQSEGLQGYATHKLYRGLIEDSSQLGLLQVAIWCIGEYGTQLTTECPAPDADPSSYGFPAIPENEVINLLDKCMRLHNIDISTKGVILNALVKLSVRLSPSCIQTITALIAPFQTSLSLELQQRSSEYTVLLDGGRSGLCRELFGKMPVLDEAAMRRRSSQFDDNTFESGKNSPKPQQDIFSSGTMPSSFSNPTSSVSAGHGNDLLNLDDIFGGGQVTPAPAVNHNYGQQQQQQQSPVRQANPNDLIASMFSMPTPAPQQQHNMYAVPPAPMQHLNMDLLSLGMPTTQQQAAVMSPNSSSMPMISLAPVANTTIKAWDKAGFQIFMDVSKPNPQNLSQSLIRCKFVNLNNEQLENLVFQAAVPKYFKLEILPPSSTTIPPNSNGMVTQEIKLTNSMQGEKNIMLKLKIGYKQGNLVVDEQTQVSSFPPLY